MTRRTRDRPLDDGSDERCRRDDVEHVIEGRQLGGRRLARRERDAQGR